jgi:hypothetical protein
MKNTYKSLLLAGIVTMSSSVLAAHHEGYTANEELAVAWVKAGHTGKAETKAMIEENMAADGIAYQNRYVGFGFSYDPQNEDDMIITNITPESPAAAILKEGDTFVSVRGIPATKDNRDKLSFRGKPGEAVNAVVMRGDKTIPVEISRGVIAGKTPKSEVLEGIELANAENWPVTEGSIVEVISKDNVVFVVHEVKDVDNQNGMAYEAYYITRLEFNDAGKVANTRGMGEDRFVLEQTGFTISR